MKKFIVFAVLMVIYSLTVLADDQKLSYPIVDTGQIRCYNNSQEIKYPEPGDAFFGQDAHYQGHTPKYKDNKNDTITDLVTGLMWQRSPGEKKSLKQAQAEVSKVRTGDYQDWRIPTIKELYSLILFSGTDPDPRGTDTSGLTPFIDTKYFDFRYGDPDRDERIIDSQYGSSTKYVSTTMRADATLFGVNFADGRIKGYPLTSPRTREENKYFFIYVRGNESYGKNKFTKSAGGTITDRATGLMWMPKDSGSFKAGPYKNGRMNWKEALAWAENFKFAGYSDWRLPNIKELQSIVDYKRSLKTTGSPAIDPIFKLSQIRDEEKNKNYPFMWSSSTHTSQYDGRKADYIAFGEGLGWMKDRRTGDYKLMDVHGAGCQRSDPKEGDPADYPHGHGPQGDVRRIYNFALLVRDGQAKKRTSGPEIEMKEQRRNPGRRR
jgi:hypothetical protein